MIYMIAIIFKKSADSGFFADLDLDFADFQGFGFTVDSDYII